MSGEINWGEPIEAWNIMSGKTVPMRLEDTADYGRRVTEDCPDPATSNTWWSEDGASRCVGSPWRIRNVAQATHQLRTAPSGGEVGPEVVERMMQHLRGMAAQYDAGKRDIDYAYAKDIVALLPEPVDADLLEARKILSDAYEAGGQLYLAARQTVMAGNADDEPRLQAVLLGIKRGRALEKGEAA